MPTLDEVYRKFGEVSEAAQLLETELGNLLLAEGIDAANLVEQPDSPRATDLVARINRNTLGQLIRNLRSSAVVPDQLEDLLNDALIERNRLSHSFYRQHNFRRNSEEGRAVMLEDLYGIHAKFLEAYKSVLLLSGIDLDAIHIASVPERHRPI